VAFASSVRFMFLNNCSYRDQVMVWTTGVHFPAGAMMGIILFDTASVPALGPTQPHAQWVPAALIRGPEADHSPPCSVEVKKVWSYTSIPPVRLPGEYYLQSFSHTENLKYRTDQVGIVAKLERYPVRISAGLSDILRFYVVFTVFPGKCWDKAMK
jgi:hypothetical protein